jgi:hypothetical protein
MRLAFPPRATPSVFCLGGMALAPCFGLLLALRVAFPSGESDTEHSRAK